MKSKCKDWRRPYDLMFVWTYVFIGLRYLGKMSFGSSARVQYRSPIINIKRFVNKDLNLLQKVMLAMPICTMMEQNL